MDLVKMDIEGGEQALLTEHTEWLDQIRFIVAAAVRPFLTVESGKR